MQFAFSQQSMTRRDSARSFFRGTRLAAEIEKIINAVHTKTGFLQRRQNYITLVFDAVRVELHTIKPKRFTAAHTSSNVIFSCFMLLPCARKKQKFGSYKRHLQKYFSIAGHADLSMQNPQAARVPLPFPKFFPAAQCDRIKICPTCILVSGGESVTVYADLLFIVNLYIDALLLSAVRRFFAAAAYGKKAFARFRARRGVWAFCLLPALPGVVLFPLALLESLALCAAAFAPKPMTQLLKAAFLLFLFGAALSGLLTAAAYFLPIHGICSQTARCILTFPH